MDKYLIVMKWDYEYDKEGTWFDEDSGEERYELNSGAAYPLPHIRQKALEVLSVDVDGEKVTATLLVDHQSFTLSLGDEPVKKHASYSYSVCGDSVHQSLCLTLSIERSEG